MSEAVAARAHPLPAGVRRLLEGYARSRPGAEARLWSRQPDGWTCLYPEGCEEAAPLCDVRRAIEWPDADHVEVELSGPGPEGDLDFIAASLDQVLAYEREAQSAAHELSERYEEINLLYSISEILASFLSMEEATTRILDEVADVLGARRAALWVLEKASNRLVLTAAVGDEGATGPIDVDDPHSITAGVFRDRQPVNLERGDRLPHGTHQEPRPQGQEPYLSVPVNYTPPEGRGRTVGVVTLVGRRTDIRFSAGDARLLTAVASQVGAALETQRLVRESLRRERFERELELAHDLQLKLLPDASLFEGHARVAARCAPAESVGGDLYNLFELSGGRLGVVIGDVSSHGFSAALIMALTMSALAIYAQESSRPGEVLRRMHTSLIDELESTEMYLTILYAIIDREAGEVVYANAGHPHAFVIGAEGDVERLGATSPPLGTFPLPEYGESQAAWDDEDLLLLFTDGLSDAFSGASGISGEQQLLKEVTRMRGRAPQDILEHLFEVAGTGELNVPPDDRTAVLLRS